MFLLDGKPLSPDRAFTHAGVQYPANWLRLSTLEEKQAIGIIEVPDPEPYDQRFYWGPGLPKDHGQLVEQWTQQTRTTANTLLVPTDWIIIREADNGKAADPALKQWREDIRLATGVKVEAINATADTTELAAYITGTEYPVWPADPYAPQPEPELIFDDTMVFSGGATGVAIL
jgi:hypothetical protein